MRVLGTSSRLSLLAVALKRMAATPPQVFLAMVSHSSRHSRRPLRPLAETQNVSTWNPTSVKRVAKSQPVISLVVSSAEMDSTLFWAGDRASVSYVC